MKKILSNAPYRCVRLGSSDIEDQVRQAVASATLEGLKPSQQAVDLVRAVATGRMNGEVALDTLRVYHGRHTISF